MTLSRPIRCLEWCLQMTGRPVSLAFSLALLVALTVGWATPSDSWAKSKSSSSSGGYSRPSSGRTPSTRAISAPRSRTPSTSGGYSRPRSDSASTSSAIRGGESDRALARRASKQALDAFRASTQPPPETLSRPQTSTPATVSAPRRPSTAGVSYPRQPSAWTGSRSWTGGQAAAPVARQAAASFGPWSAALLWGLLESVSRPGHAEFFYHHAEDPGYRAWRAEAEKQARDDPQIARQLAALDTRLAGMSGPRDPDYPPPIAEPAAEPPAQTESFPYGALLAVLFLLLVGALVTILIWRRFFGDVAKRRSGARARAARQTDRPNWFRVGMTLPVDPSLFILAAPYSAVQAPEAATASGLLSVETVGEAVCEGLTWYRLYVSGGNSFFQVHLDARGNPDECRYFSLLDEVTPADAAEWGVWLDEAEGLIGWPEFETKDGRLYQRLWSAGERRVAPRAIHETLETGEGSAPRRRQQAMLYARSTGAVPPAPPTDYLLVSAVDQEDAAWVTIHTGIDLPIASLQLS